MLSVLIVTKIFPNAAEPDFAPYNVQQFGALARRARVHLLAPLPWFPGASLAGARSRAAKLTNVPPSEPIGDLVAHHPRILHTPRLFSLSGPAYVASLLPRLWPQRKDYDVILGAFAYPDGYAAIRLGELLGLPAVVKLHGGDLNVVANLPGPRFHLRRVLPRASRVVAVSRALADKAVALGVDAERVDVVENGVDTSLFSPRDRGVARRELGVDLERRLIVYVGRIERRKGVFELLEAFGTIAPLHPSVDLALIGPGEDEAECRGLAAPLGARVRFLGAQPLPEVARWLAASDVLTLPSHDEGTPNVVLEALSSGRRVVATRVGGIPAAVPDPALGELVPARDPAALASALAKVALSPYDPVEIARLGGRGDWAASAAGLLNSLERAVSRA